MKEPWAETWEVESPLSKGGQGATFLVRSKSEPNLKAVLKLQVDERKKDAKSRQRMHQEVSNLQIASSTTAKVPKVLDSNTHLYGTSDDLFFVMEYIDGDSLESVMVRDKMLSVDDAFDLALDLSKTLLACHEKSIMHRDLKPGNLIIRGRKPIDAVIVDYGLSFNEEESEQNDLTSQGEPIGNSFTDLPERRTPDAQRHYESDLTAVIGIMYYCITGQRPNPFRDAHGDPPHRRKQPGLSLRDIMKDHPATTRLELLFDRAFERVISDRFSSAKEMIDRLLHAKAATGREPKRVADILKNRSSQILSSSRKVQLHSYSEAAAKVIQTCVHELMSKSQSNSRFRLGFLQAPQNAVPSHFPPDMSCLQRGFAVSVTVNGLNEVSAAEFAFAAQGTDTAILRRRMEILPQQQGRPGPDESVRAALWMNSITRSLARPAEDWQVRLWYPGDGQPDNDELMNELGACVETLIDELEERLR